MDLGDKKADSHQIKQVMSLETARTQAFVLPPSLSYPLSLYLGLNRESLSLSCHFPKGPKWITTSHFSFGLLPLVVQPWRELGSACSSHVAPWWEAVLKPHCRSHLLCAMEWQQFGETHLPTVSRHQSNIKTRGTQLLKAPFSLSSAFSEGGFFLWMLPSSRPTYPCPQTSWMPIWTASHDLRYANWGHWHQPRCHRVDLCGDVWEVDGYESFEILLGACWKKEEMPIWIAARLPQHTAVAQDSSALRL